MRYDPIDNKLFVINRKNFSKLLKKKSLAIFNANDEFPRSGDQTFPFKQNADLFYLSGIDQEQTILVLFPDCPNPLYREILFLRQTDEDISVWEGHKYTKEDASKVSGIGTVYWLNDFWNVLSSVIHYCDTIYINSNENDRYDPIVPYKDLRFLRKIKRRYPLHHYERSAPFLRDLRSVKSSTEIELTKKACTITKNAFIRVLKFIQSGIREYEIEAEIIHEFIRHGATGHAYQPIIASGANATILHYNDNDQICKNGDIILFDFGAEYANYNADMSRSVPVNGKFTQRQKNVYNSVLLVMKEAKKMMVPGTTWNDYNKEIARITENELIKLNLLSKTDIAKQNPKSPLYKKYFMHGISHHLGLDVHDLGDRSKPFETGNLLTCEPGIYIPQEKLGIRLENNILITENGNIDLMDDIPLEVEEIEEIMNSK